MEYQDKILLLRKYKDAIKLAKYYQEELDQYRATKEQAGIQKLSDMPKAHGGQSDLSDYIVKLDEMQGKIYSQLIKAQNMKTNIMVWCESLVDVDEKLIIQYHYLQDHKFGWIADEMHYSEKTVKRKHNKAIAHLPNLNFIELWL